MTKKVLIITYYWPPSGGSGVQRWLKFTKYLGRFGWKPIVYTALNPEVSTTDSSLLTDIPADLTVIKRKIIEPYQLFRWATKQKSNMGAGFATDEKRKSGILSNFSLWIRANFFIPDARMLWIKPSVNYLKVYLKKHPVDLVITSGPPHSMHLIGLKLTRHLKIPWIADFRDPWTNIDYFAELPIEPFALKKHKAMEKKVLENADGVIVVSPQMRREFEEHKTKGIEVITNGFDEEDFQDLENATDSAFTITHVGSIPPNRNCNLLWKSIKKLVDTNSDFASSLKIQLLGSVDASVLSDIDASGLTDFLCNYGYLSHSKSIELMQQSRVLLLLINQSANAKGILTGKLFEYLAAKRPILAIGPKGGDVEKLILQTNSGVFAQYTDEENIYQKLNLLWLDSQNPTSNYTSNGISEYSREKLTEKLTILMDRILSQRSGMLTD